MSSVKQEKVQLKQSMLDLKRRVQEMELLVGVDDEEVQQIIRMHTGKEKEQ